MNNRHGRSNLIQMIITLLLILCFGAGSFLLVAAESGSYKRLKEMREECLNLRVGMNYLLTRIRQFDATGAITIYDSPVGLCLVLREDIGGEAYETRIFLQDNKMRECFTPAYEPFNADAGFDIADIDSFNIDYINAVGLINIELSGGNDKRSVMIKTGTDGDPFE